MAAPKHNRRCSDHPPQTKTYNVLPWEVRNWLLQVARESVRARLAGRRDRPPQWKWEWPAGFEPPSRPPGGVFVSLYLKEQLRGCIGTVALRGPSLPAAVADYARNAAFQDTRFSPLTADELPRVHFEISVLSPLETIDEPEQVNMDRHGIVVRGVGKYQGRQGVYLPQVAERFGKDHEAYIEHCCEYKASFAPAAWRDRTKTQIFVFTAEVFSEEEQGAAADT